jgi:branched-chain amino acid transport system permease protein
MLILQLVINGILVGALYTCIALGFSIMWGVMNLINLAHGSLIMLGAYIAVLLFTFGGVDPFLAIPVSAAVLFAVGYLLQRWVINLVIRGSVFLTLILTFGFDMLLVNVMLVLFSADTRSVTPSYSGLGFAYGNLVVPYIRIGVFLVAVTLTFLLSTFLTRTKLGNAIRSTSFDREAAELVGVDVARIFPLTFGIGAAMAGAAGALVATTYSISPVLGGAFTMKAFVVVVLGGLGSVPGAVLGGLTLGVVEHLSTLVAPPGYQEGIGFIVLLIVLVLRPSGLLGKPFYAEVKA